MNSRKRPTSTTKFLNIIKLLTKRGKKVGMSTYYNPFRLSGKQRVDLLLRLSIFEIDIDDELQQFISSVKNDWLHIYDYLTLRYAKRIDLKIKKMLFIVITLLLIQTKKNATPTYIINVTTHSIFISLVVKELLNIIKHIFYLNLIQ